MGNTVNSGTLSTAVKNGDIEECKKLIESGSQVNDQTNMWKCAPLHEACRFGYHEIAALLIKSGAFVNVVDCIGRTPLHYATKGNFLSVMYLLLQNGANVDIVADNSKSCLHFAIEEAHRAAVLLLLEYNCDSSIQDDDGCSAFQQLLYSNSYKSLLILHAGLTSDKATKIEKSLNWNNLNVAPKVKIMYTHWRRAAKSAHELILPSKQTYEQGSTCALEKYLKSVSDKFIPGGHEKESDDEDSDSGGVDNVEERAES